MALSGTLPFYDTTSTVTDPGGDVVVTITGSVAGPGLPSGGVTHASEPINLVLRRWVTSIGAASGISGISGLASIVNVQREMAARISDLEKGPETGAAARLVFANAILTTAGELASGDGS